MLQLADSLNGLAVMSLRTGGMVARAERPIINPNNLKIEGWYCRDHFSKQELILLTKDLRDIVPQGLAIDDYEVLSTPEELIRLKGILALDFQLVGKPTITNNGRKLGKVSDFATDTSSFFIKKLYINQPIYRTLNGGQLSLDRTQIVEITPKQIVVRDVEEKAGSPVAAFLGVR
jgi:sporulation protein YlmC with PRC-barrel domain